MSRLTLSISRTLPIPEQPRPVASERWPQWLPDALFLAAGIVVLTSYLFLAFAHIRDRYQVNFVSGVYTGLAMHLNAGSFYPEFFDGTRYGGTRYMPLHFVLHAGLARLTGEYLFSGKVLTILQAFALFALLTWAGCKRKCGFGVALGLSALVVLTEPGLISLTTIRGDLLPVIFQLLAVILVAEQLTRRRLAFAALLCAFAFLAKLSALWGPVAIACWTFRRQRSLTWLFVSSYLLWTIGSVLLLDSFAEGRMIANMFGLSTSGVRTLASLLSPLMFLWRIAQSGPLPTLLLPLCLAGSLLAWRQQRLTLYHFALGVCVLNTLGIYLDKEATNNHLLDCIVLTVPVLACLWSDLKRKTPPPNPLPETERGSKTADTPHPQPLSPKGRGEEEAPPPRFVEGVGGRGLFGPGRGVDLQPLLALLLLWGMYMAWSNMLVKPAFEAVQGFRYGASAEHYPPRPLPNLIGEHDPVLCEDAWVSIARNQLPVVLDPYSLGRLSESKPELVEPLVGSIRAQKFRWIVLCQELGDPCLMSRYRWEDRHFGPQVVKAMRENYRLHSKNRGYFVYEPGPGQNAQARE